MDGNIVKACKCDAAVFISLLTQCINPCFGLPLLLLQPVPYLALPSHVVLFSSYHLKEGSAGIIV